MRPSKIRNIAVVSSTLAAITYFPAVLTLLASIEAEKGFNVYVGYAWIGSGLISCIASSANLAWLMMYYKFKYAFLIAFVYGILMAAASRAFFILKKNVGDFGTLFTTKIFMWLWFTLNFYVMLFVSLKKANPNRSGICFFCVALQSV